MSLLVRPETDSDDAGSREVLIAAFPTAAEADLVKTLRDDLASEIALVAEEKDMAFTRIVGHVMLSRMQVQGEGRCYRALGLGPVAVLPRRQRNGIGSALIRNALKCAQRLGEELIFVVGEPDYYRRFGFAAETAAPFGSPYAGPCFMALKLRAIELPTQGRAEYAPAFARLAEP